MTKAQVIALIDQYITTNGNQEITGAQTNSVMKALANQDIPFAEITNKPTTLSGYGITDAYTKSVSDGRYVNVDGDTMTGALTAGNGITVTGGHLNLNDFRRINFGSSQDAYIVYDGSGNRLNMILNSSVTDFRILDGSNPIMTIDRLSNNTTFEQTIIGNNGFRAFGSLAPWFDAIVTNNTDSNIFRGRDSNNNTIGSITTRGFNGSGGGYLSLNGEWRINENSFWHSGNFTPTNYVLTTRSILAGVGLTGGGNLESNLTINFDTSWGDSRYALQSRQINTGNHLSGGGNLSANRTLTLTPTVNQYIVDSEGNQRMYFYSNSNGGIILKSSATGGQLQYRDMNNNQVFRVSDSGNVTATSFSGSIDASNIDSGKLADTRLQVSNVTQFNNAINPEKVNGIRLWVGTQAEYDAISNKRNDTLYFITQ